MNITINYEPNEKQKLFHECDADEVVYGGAKGGGKSCALVMECLAYGLENAGASMYIFRETYDDLEANIIREWKEKVPRELYSYHESKHVATLINGTSVKFRYIRNFADAEGYQGRSMDWIGVDELTKHEKKSIQVLLSCLRSPKGFKPTFRGTCNPGGIGHTWVKEDFIEATEYGKKPTIDEVTNNKRVFIPAKVYDNVVLMQNDPNYVKRLENLPEKERKAFLDGDWDIFEGQYFGEFKRHIHVVEPFVIPQSWQRFRFLDYGLDMLAAYWAAIDTQGNVFVYKELYESDLIISSAAQRIKDMTNEDIKLTYAPPDLWNRRQDTGKSASDLFRENGIPFVKANNERIQGWLNLKEWLKPYETLDEQTGETVTTARLKLFSNCVNLIRTLPQLQRDEKDPNDVASEPHELTHGPDALRYFCSMRMRPSKKAQEKDPDNPTPQEKHQKAVKAMTGGRANVSAFTKW
ncbi:phage terminase large subunit [Paenibacillus silvisoli]|uniref:phage terminase large subunit n=1 Tax=Paenibacillus silvisoli TaxID=3110539 RepID=UPI00280552A5|nr:phage terminase large subunit [Paenibacillus silvisoli]